MTDITVGQSMVTLSLGVAASLTYLADAYTTMIGLNNGRFSEGNPINRFLFKKIGLPLTVFLFGSAMLWFGGYLTNYGVAKADTFFGIIAGVEALVALRNYKLLKAAKISLK